MESLKKLREIFLHEKDEVRRKDYWDSEETLRYYDETFAQRIGWKWQAVLREFVEKVQVPSKISILDWGCGSGIATRTFLSQFPDHECEVYLYDRSNKAARFAQEKICEQFPKTQVKLGLPKEKSQVLLLSHVLNEVDEKTLNSIKQLILKSDFTLWVEAGTYEISRKLIQVREELRPTLSILAPCPHQESCPILLDKNVKHWCHNFAEAPAEVFHSRFWTEFSKTFKIDLRSLPTSFLILSRNQFTLAKEENRILGRNKRLKSHVELVTCTSSKQIEEVSISRRENVSAYKEYSESEFHKIYHA